MSESCRVLCGGLMAFGLFFFVFLLGVRFGFEYAFPMAKLEYLVDRNGQLETEFWKNYCELVSKKRVIEEDEE